MNLLHRIQAFTLTAFFSVCTTAAESPPENLDELVAALMTQDGIPGLALVIVKDGQVVVTKGYGTRTAGQQEPVDADTLFGLASTTKAFTAAALGMLVDRDTISFDDLVVDVLPGFCVADPYVSANATVRDLLAHRTATDPANMLWYAHKEMPRGELIRHLRDVPQLQSFRKGFVYSSLMYVAAGRILFAQTGKTWEEFVAENIFKPLAMERTTTDMRGLGALDNVASAHISIEGKILRIPHSDEVNTGPAGLIYSSANDVAHWLQFLIGGGVFEGQQLLKEETLDDIMSPQMVVDELLPFEELIYFDSSFVTAGLGWFISDYRGRKSLSHTGGMDGMAAFISLLPSENLAVGIFVNLERNMARVAIRNWIYDHYLGVDDTDWVPRYRQWSDKLWGGFEEMAAEAGRKRDPNSAASLPLGSFVGRYHDDLVGDLEIALTDTGSLLMHLGDIYATPLEHWQANEFRIIWSNPLLNYPVPSLLDFKPGTDGHPDSVVLSGPADLVFKRVE